VALPTPSLRRPFFSLNQISQNWFNIKNMREILLKVSRVFFSRPSPALRRQRHLNLARSF
jgi:hypothetical protein